MRDAEGRQRLALKRIGGKRAPETITAHCSIPVDTHARITALMVAEGRYSLSGTIGYLLGCALSDDAITSAEARIILRGLNALMTEDPMSEDTMGQIETLTEKLLRCFPEHT